MTKQKNKKKNIQSTQRLVIVSAMMIAVIIAMITYWIFAYEHKQREGSPFISYRVSDYSTITGNTITLKNLPEEIITKLSNSQNNIISSQNVISTDIKRNITKNILSIKISYILYADLANYEEIITLNYDLKNKEEVSNKKLLEMAGTTYKEIATGLFNEYIKVPDTSTRKTVVDAITEEEMTAREFNQNSEKYIIRIREKLPEVLNIYIDNNKIYGIIRQSEIEKVCYYTNRDVSMAYIEKELGKI